MTAAITNPGVWLTAWAVLFVPAAAIACALWGRMNPPTDGPRFRVPFTDHLHDEAAQMLRRQEQNR